MEPLFRRWVALLCGLVRWEREVERWWRMLEWRVRRSLPIFVNVYEFNAYYASLNNLSEETGQPTAAES